MDLGSLLSLRGDRIVHREHRPGQSATIEPWPAWVSPAVREVFAADGIDALWGHQAEALALLRAGQNVVVATGTASGKSLIYQVPAMQTLSEGRVGSALDGHRRPTVLYLSPTKALAADQKHRLPSNLPWLRAATVDGDNTAEERSWARDHANLILANPDVLHHSLLPHHQRWSRFWSGLSMVVVDETHQYRGVFGSHVAQVLRRVRRVAAEYRATPQFVFSSATMAEPGASASKLVGLPVTAVTDDVSERGDFDIVFWQPPLLPGGPTPESRVRRSAAREAAELLTDLVVAGERTLVFVSSRRGAEQVSRRAQDLLAEVDPSLASLVGAYRSGYLPEERRELEADLRDGRLRGLVSTSALELGIDISGLDAVISVGFPGTRAGLWQRFGRAGRSGTSGLGVLIARDEPLDAHVVHHPESILGAPVEAAVFDPDNPYVLGPHLAAAAQEVPLTAADFEIFGPNAEAGVLALTEAGMLRRRPHGWFWTRPDRASNLADLRSTGGHQIQIVDGDTGRLIGTVDASSADRDVHTDAVYVHRGEDFVIVEYDPEDKVAVARRADVHHTTQAHSSSSIVVLTEREQQRWGSGTVSWGQVEVTGQVTGFDLYDRQTGRSLGEQPLDLPEHSLTTSAVWWTLADDTVHDTLDESRVPGAAHAAEHAAIGILPLIATCDRWDIGGVSTARHADTGRLTVFVHDGHPGGAGFAERGFVEMRRWLQMTRNTIAECECVDGCPACVVSPKCGNRNNPLDKSGAVLLLDALLDQ